MNIDACCRTCLIIVLTAAPAAAQGGPSRRELNREVLAGAGFVQFSDDEGSLGTGPVVSAGAAYRVHPRLAIEVSVQALRHVRDVGEVRFRGTAAAGVGRLLYQFGSRRVQPYVFGGGGWLHSHRTTTFPLYAERGNAPPVRSGSTSFDVSDAEAGWCAGGGVRVPWRERLVIRPELQVFVSSPGYLVPFTVVVAAGYGF